MNNQDDNKNADEEGMYVDNSSEPQESSNTVPENTGEPKTLEQQHEELQQQSQEYLAGWQRALADYRNLQTDTSKRISENIKYSTEAFLMELLPIADYFSYAFKAIPESDRESNWLKGIEYIHTNFMKVLEEHGVEVMKTVGEKFNTEFHDAVEEVEGSDTEGGIIVEEVAPGFILNGKVVRHAKVKVAK